MENKQQQKRSEITTTTSHKANEQQQPNNINDEEEEQQQSERHPPKLTIRTKGIEITDMKQFLAEKRKERATRMGSVENVKTKVYSAERHNQPNIKFWSSAHKDRTVGISGQNEPNGSKSSAAKGIR